MRAGLGSTLHTSLVLHLLGLSAMSLLSSGRPVPTPPPVLMTTELLVSPPAPVEPEAPLVPQLEPIPDPAPLAPPPPAVLPPRLVTKPKLERVPVLEKPALPITRVRTHDLVAPRPQAPTRSATRALRRDVLSPMPPGAATPAAGGSGSGAHTERVQEPPAAAPAAGNDAGAGQLFARGDVGVIPGAGAEGGGGGTHRGRLGIGEAGASGTHVASVTPGAGGSGSGSGSGNALARPLGGYQVKPRYPEAARRQGVQGTTLLRVHVNAQGLVEDILVTTSAGYTELDLAAMEAVRQWKFEPAKQGQQAVAVWVTLPVRFTLR